MGPHVLPHQAGPRDEVVGHAWHRQEQKVKRTSGIRGKYRTSEVVEAVWRPVRPPWKKDVVLNNIFIAVLFFVVSGAFFVGSGIWNYWELKNHGEETLAHLLDLDYSPDGVNSSASFGYDLLTVSFFDHQGNPRSAQFYERGRYAFENDVNPYNPQPSLPKEVWIIYSRRNHEVVELRDYRNHRWWMFGFSVLFALGYPVILHLGRRASQY